MLEGVPRKAGRDGGELSRKVVHFVYPLHSSGGSVHAVAYMQLQSKYLKITVLMLPVPTAQSRPAPLARAF